MAVHIVQAIWFSPMYHTREVTRALAGQLARNLNASLEKYDITAHEERVIEFLPEHLAIIGVPVYAGRVPNLARFKLEKLSGNGAKAILVTSFGNRAYDNALVELRDILLAQNFMPIAAAAAVARHTIAKVYADGRPNSDDLEELAVFGDKISKKLTSQEVFTPVVVPGIPPTGECPTFPLPQSVDDNCVLCGICWKKCPAAAITYGAPHEVDVKKCICCMRCVNVCPEGARHADPAFINNIVKKLAPVCAVPKKNEYFLSE